MHVRALNLELQVFVKTPNGWVLKLVCDELGGIEQIGIGRWRYDDFIHAKSPSSRKAAISANKSKLGIFSRQMVPYSRACREGWAPFPTNAVQKAFWEKVHAIPDRPITIEFDPKKDK